ncbi:hypothetical protein DFJ73DRAFT_820378 [Zopfochytrium polystomum]|nr:hypothetical protein DFJ73DRAFT_820378 [Zopfochytrium polystomum]
MDTLSADYWMIRAFMLDDDILLVHNDMPIPPFSRMGFARSPLSRGGPFPLFGQISNLPASSSSSTSSTSSKVVDPDGVFDLPRLPPEVHQEIFAYLTPAAAERLMLSSKYFRELSKSPSLRAQWIIQLYGRSVALEASLRWTKLVDAHTLQNLIKTCGPAPRYVVQRAILRYQFVNQSAQLLLMLTHAMTQWSDLSLNRLDDDTFLRAVEDFRESGQSARETFRQTIMKLVDDYRFNVNFVKCCSEKGLPRLAVNEGFMTFLDAVNKGSQHLVQLLLDLGVQTFLPVNRKEGPPFNVTFFPPLYYFSSSVRRYIKSSIEPMLLAVRAQDETILRILLEADTARWRTAGGQEALKSALQLSVDENFSAATELLKTFTEDLATPKRSPEALKKLLVQACLTGNLEDVKRWTREGARFEVVVPEYYVLSSCELLKEMVDQNQIEIVDYLIHNYPFDSIQLSELLVSAIASIKNSIVRRLLSPSVSVMVPITIKALRRCLMNWNFEALDLCLTALEARSSTAIFSGFLSTLRCAKRKSARRDMTRFVERLEQYQATIEENKRNAAEAQRQRKAAQLQKSSSAKGRKRPLAEVESASKRPEKISKLSDEVKVPSSSPMLEMGASTTSASTQPSVSSKGSSSDVKGKEPATSKENLTDMPSISSAAASSNSPFQPTPPKGCSASTGSLAPITTPAHNALVAACESTLAASAFPPTDELRQGGFVAESSESPQISTTNGESPNSQTPANPRANAKQKRAKVTEAKTAPVKTRSGRISQPPRR